MRYALLGAFLLGVWMSPVQATVDGTLTLDGPSSPDWLQVDNAPELNPTGGITIEAWVRPTANSGCYTIVGKSFGDGYWLGLCSGKIRYYTNGSGSSRDGVKPIPVGEWTHLAVTFDGTTRRYYVDGILDIEESTPANLPITTTDLGIGAEASGSFPFQGNLAEVRIWDHARDREAIRGDVSRQIREEEEGLIAVWNLAGSPDDALGRNRARLRSGARFTGGAAPPEPFFPLRIPRLASAPSVNGACVPGEYGSLRLPIYYPDDIFGGTSGDVRWVRVGATAGRIYTCFDGLAFGITSPESFAGVYIDPDNSGGTVASPTDFRGTVTQTTEVVQSQWGNGAGGFTATFNDPAESRRTSAARSSTTSRRFRFHAASSPATPTESSASS